jgi:hypothetical protein
VLSKFSDLAFTGLVYGQPGASLPVETQRPISSFVISAFSPSFSLSISLSFYIMSSSEKIKPNEMGYEKCNKKEFLILIFLVRLFYDPSRIPLTKTANFSILSLVPCQLLLLFKPMMMTQHFSSLGC